MGVCLYEYGLFAKVATTHRGSDEITCGLSPLALSMSCLPQHQKVTIFSKYLLLLCCIFLPSIKIKRFHRTELEEALFSA